MHDKSILFYFFIVGITVVDLVVGNDNRSVDVDTCSSDIIGGCHVSHVTCYKIIVYGLYIFLFLTFYGHMCM